MQNEIDSLLEYNESRPSLLLLNEYCLLDIFEFLELEDSISLAESCSRLRSMANRIFKEHLLLDSKTLLKGEQYIDHIFLFIGEYVSSLKLDLIATHLDVSKILGIINDDCSNLGCLSIVNWTEVDEINLHVHSFDNLQHLTLEESNFHVSNSILENFNQLKSLNISNCSIQPKGLRRVLQNNPNIETIRFWSGYGRRFDFNCQLLELLPNVQGFSLGGRGITDIWKLNSLPKMNRLTKLRLDCKGININDFLRQLAIDGLLEEVDIFDVETDADFFDILSTFEKLRLLVITRRYNQLDPSLTNKNWPTKLKQLRLVNFVLTDNDLVSIIRQLQCLVSIDLRFCFVPEIYKKVCFKDTAKLSQRILDVFDHSKRKQRLDLLLPNTSFVYYEEHNDSDSEVKEQSNLHRFDSYKLRILHPGIHPIYGVNQLGINVVM